MSDHLCCQLCVIAKMFVCTCAASFSLSLTSLIEEKHFFSALHVSCILTVLFSSSHSLRLLERTHAQDCYDWYPHGPSMVHL